MAGETGICSGSTGNNGGGADWVAHVTVDVADGAAPHRNPPQPAGHAPARPKSSQHERTSPVELRACVGNAVLDTALVLVLSVVIDHVTHGTPHVIGATLAADSKPEL
eukprot:1764192-Rhodomonas_salina.1